MKSDINGVIEQLHEDIAERDWDKAIATVQTLYKDKIDYAHCKLGRNGRTLLHAICKLRYDFEHDENEDGKVDEGAIELARILIQVSHDNISSLEKESEDRTGDIKSILLLQDDSLNTPLHNLWENVGDAVPAALVHLILESCNDDFVTIQDLLSVRNTHGMTVLHLLFGDAACSTAIFESIIHPLSLITVNEKAPHPILIGDDDGELPIHFACYVGLEPHKLKLLLRATHHLDDNKDGSIIKYHHTVLRSLFCLSKDNMLPIDALFYWFVQENDEDIHPHITYSSTHQVDYENLLPYLMNQDQNFVDRKLREKITDELWTRIQEILEFIVDATDWLKGNPHDDVLSSPLHTAACISSFPSAVLKTAELISSNNTDQPYLMEALANSMKTLPLHIAVSTKQRQIYSYCERTTYYVDLDNIEDTTLWQSSREPRSMIQYMLEKQKYSAEVADSSGRLPLHIAIENRLSYYTHVQPLVEAYCHGLLVQHPESNLYPFMLAAACHGIDAIYGLLIKDPSICRMHLL